MVVDYIGSRSYLFFLFSFFPPFFFSLFMYDKLTLLLLLLLLFVFCFLLWLLLLIHIHIPYSYSISISTVRYGTIHTTSFSFFLFFLEFYLRSLID